MDEHILDSIIVFNYRKKYVFSLTQVKDTFVGQKEQKMLEKAGTISS